MTAPSDEAELSSQPAHDHAWRKISTREAGRILALGAYRCDVCDEIWFM